MRLMQIKLSGFKSFADHTVIHVPGQRVAVVGPNGCGKSNVIDAVRWVLGESSAKQLRGQSMQDVIFNGAHTRKALSRASVELVFDNSDYVLSGSWGQYAEIAIKRSLNRNGDSLYQINQQTVRRRDITDLFLGTGVGTRGYAVIEQGMISRIIESKPEDLRGFIEEAAGVSKYKERRRETESRLNDTKSHLSRLSDLRHELQKQSEKLNRQAQTALRYQELKHRLGYVQDALDYVLWQSALAEENTLSTRRNLVQSQLDQLSARQVQLHDELYHQQLAEHVLQDKMQKIAQERTQLREDCARLEEKLRHHHLQRLRREKEAQAAAVELQQLSQKIELIKQEKQLNQQQEEEYQAVLEEYAYLREEVNIRLPEIERRYQLCEKQGDESRQALNQLEQEWALLLQEKERNQLDIDNLLEREKILHTQQYELPNLAPMQEKWHILRQSQDILHNQKIQLDEEEKSVQITLEKLIQQKKELEKQALTYELQYAAIQKTLPQNETNSPWTEEDDWAILWQHTQAQTQWQYALSSLLARKLHTRFAPDFRLPENAPSYQGCWISRPLSAKPTQESARLLSKVQTHPSFQAALNLWLGDVFCAEDLNEAIEKQSQLTENQSFITPEGHYVDCLSVVLNEQAPVDNILSRQAQCQDLQQQLDAIQPEISAVNQAIKQVQESLNQIINANKQHQQHEDNLREEINQCQRQLDLSEQQYRLAEEKIKQQQNDRASLNQDKNTLKNKQEEYIERINQLQNRLPESRNQAQQYKEEKNNLQQELSQLRNEALQLERQYHHALNNLHQSQEKGRQFNQEIDNAQLRHLALMHHQEHIEPLEEDSEKQENTLATWRAEEEKQQAQYTENQSILHKMQADLKKLHQEQSQLNQEIPSIQNQFQAALLAAQEASIAAQSYRQHLLERGADISELSSQEHPNKNQLNQEINQLSQAINRLGAVNLAAAEELQQIEERQDYYQTQDADLNSAIEQLTQAIAQIDQESKKRFKETFNQVNQHMQHYFPTLFGGGEARLELTDDDLLSTGISIIARPPGKKNSSIHLLSGGEKALCAMSLVFALFSLNPAPFCLLDEVDAPLDDANTVRFCRLIEEMSAKTQFLYISHNRQTMESAEQLIGVTMQEKGVSRIVSVDIQAALGLAES